MQAVRALVAPHLLGLKLLLQRGVIPGLLSLIKPQHLASLADWEAQPGYAGQLPGGRTVPGLVAAILQDGFLQPQSNFYRDLYQARIIPGQLCHQTPLPEQVSGIVMLVVGIPALLWHQGPFPLSNCQACDVLLYAAAILLGWHAASFLSTEGHPSHPTCAAGAWGEQRDGCSHALDGLPAGRQAWPAPDLCLRSGDVNLWEAVRSAVHSSWRRQCCQCAEVSDPPPTLFYDHAVCTLVTSCPFIFSTLYI